MKQVFSLLLAILTSSFMVATSSIYDFSTMNLSPSTMSITNGSVSYNSSKGYYEVSNNANDTLSMTISGVPNVVFEYWAETSKKAFKIKPNECIQLDGAFRTLRISNLNINDIVTLTVASKGSTTANSFSGGLTNCTLYSGNLTQGEYSYPLVYEDVSFQATSSTIEITNTAGGYCLEQISIGQNQNPQYSGTCGPNLTWALNRGVLTISGTGNMTNYSMMDPYAPSPWHSYSYYITSVIINDGVTGIGNDAFSDCRLTSVTIPNSVTSIGNYAFYICTELASVIIPNSVTQIGEGAFLGCSSLASVTIPNSVTSIGESVFSSCTGLRSVTIPNSVTSIGRNAFNDCRVLASITIPNSVTSIGDHAFAGCSGLTSITMGNSVTSIGEYAFSECNGLTKVNISDISAWLNIDFTSYSSNPLLVARRLYLNGNELTNLVIPDSISSIKNYAFYNCSSLTKVTIPNSVTSIGDWSFRGCDELDALYLESSTPSQLGNRALNSTSSSFKIIVPCGALEAYQNDWSTYASQIQITPSAAIQTAPLVEGTGQVNVPQYICDTILEAIPAYGYHFVQWTDSVTDNPRIIDSEVEATYIAEFALDKYGRCGDDLLLLWSYDSDNHTLTISGNGTFNSNMYYGIEAPSEMTTLVIEDSVQSVGASAFASISTLTSVTLGQDVSRIRENAFYNCENLTVIHNYRSAPATVYSTTFDGVDKFACTLYVPEESVSLYRAATGWRDFFNIVGFNPTGYENLSEEASSIRKVFIDGHLYILHTDGTRYDATGKKVE